MIRYITIMLLILTGFTACKRDMVNDIVSVTPPELEVIVHQGTDQKARVQGATVTLYATEADRTNGTNAIATGTTNDKGSIVFNKDQFRKGVMYIAVSKDALSGTGATPYLLQNDGKTLFWAPVN